MHDQVDSMNRTTTALTHGEIRRVAALRKVRFREICETTAGIDNKSPVIKLARLFIRYLVRTVGYPAAARILGLLLRAIKGSGTSRVTGYIRYLMEINKLRIEYIDALANNNLYAATLKKNQWAEVTLKNSMSRMSRFDARGYLSLLSRHGFYNGKCGGSRTASETVSEKRFYIYGPNASSRPSRKYADYVLVLTKPIDVDIGLFKEKILFLNSVYYYNVVCKNDVLKNEIINRYEQIYVSCRQTVLPPFIRSKFPMGAEIASAQGLGRVLYNLTRKHGKFSCVIEGFDLYLKPTAFSSYYPTLLRDKHGALSESAICHTLVDHDALYNFLYVKELAGMLDIVDSSDFKRIIEMSGESYLDELSKVRKFTLLRYA